MIAVAVFGVVPGVGDGPPVDVHEVVLDSPELRVSVLTLGAGLNRVQVLDGQTPDDVCLNLRWFDPEGGRGANPYLGATVGRYANRIGAARFPLDGRQVQLVANEGPNQLHGGPGGFHDRVWDLVAMGAPRPGSGGGDRVSSSSVTMSLRSDDGDQGYPGTLVASATYALLGDTLTITYQATTNAPTVVNLTNHAYWNLDGAGTVERHQVQVIADHYLPLDGAGLPVGPLAPVEGTPIDLREPQVVGDVMRRQPSGLDHALAVGRGAADGSPLALAATLGGPITGRTLAVRTDQPALQVYAGNHLVAPFEQHGGICLETQRFPDTPNHPELGSAVLRPGETYTSTTEMCFGTR